MIKYDTVQFDSIYDLGRHVEQLQHNRTRREYGELSTDTHRNSFYGNWSMEKAIKCALSGGDWQEGADKMPRIHVPHETLSGHVLEAPTIENDMCGFAPDVAGYLSNAPDCMYTQVDQPTSDRLLKVAVHVGRAVYTTQDQIFNRGAAIMAVLDQLSREGYAIELHALWRNADEGQGQGASIETVIKNSGDPWSPESVAFALCHASFQRRLCWRVAESMTNGGARITQTTYGNGMKAMFKDYDLSYGYVSGDTGKRLKTPDSAVEYIKHDTLQQLERLNRKAYAA